MTLNIQYNILYIIYVYIIPDFSIILNSFSLIIHVLPKFTALVVSVSLVCESNAGLVIRAFT